MIVDITETNAELVWNCITVPSGVYFIAVKHDGITDCIPVVVSK